METVASSVMEKKKIQKLICFVQNYDWGRKGLLSPVARLHALNSGSVIEPDKPYAEFWMGTLDSGPSFLLPGVSGGENITLKSWVSQNPSLLGAKVVENWGCDLPFLFKVLSVAKALSIQAHPDKELAKLLHKSLPNIYKDANHKPEMALAMTKFEALCGFVSVEEIKGVLCTYPEIIELVGSADANRVINFNDEDGEEKMNFILQSVFTKLMSASQDRVNRVICDIKSRLNRESQRRQLTEKELLVLRLEEQYPGDIGVISAFFFNYVKLNPGEALYLGANEPHAYVSGDCIECMATSDNVVRAGLTPKHRDFQTLCAMLTYKRGFPEILKGIQLNRFITRYSPPFDEFEIDRCILPEGESVSFPSIPGPSLYLVVSGKGSLSGNSEGDTIAEGDVVFVAANIEISMSSEEGELQLYRAGVNTNFFHT